jgi:hypothetical protein
VASNISNQPPALKVKAEPGVSVFFFLPLSVYVTLTTNNHSLCPFLGGHWQEEEEKSFYCRYFESAKKGPNN